MLVSLPFKITLPIGLGLMIVSGGLFVRTKVLKIELDESYGKFLDQADHNTMVAKHIALNYQLFIPYLSTARTEVVQAGCKQFEKHGKLLDFIQKIREAKMTSECPPENREQLANNLDIIFEASKKDPNALPLVGMIRALRVAVTKI